MSVPKYSFFSALAVALGFFHVGYCIHEINQIWHFAPCIYGYKPKNMQIMNTPVLLAGGISSSVASLWTGPLLVIGQRNLLIICNLIMIFGSLFQFFPIFALLIIGKILKGISIGILWSVIPPLLNQMSTIYQRGPFASLWNLYIAFGASTSLLIGLYIPDLFDIDETHEKYWEYFSNDVYYWRVLLMFPIIISLIHIILLLIILENNSNNLFSYGRFNNFRLEDEYNSDDSDWEYNSDNPPSSIQSEKSNVDSYKDLFSSK